MIRHFFEKGRDRPRRIHAGDSYEAGEEVALDEVPPADEPAEEPSEPYNTDKLPRDRWRSSGD